MAPPDLSDQLPDRPGPTSPPLTLRPGLTPVRRDADRLQVGVAPPARVLLPDTPAVRRLLTELVRGSAVAPWPEQVRPAVAALDRAGLLVEAARLRDDTRRLAGAAATYAAHGPDAERRLAARRVARVSVLGAGGMDPTALIGLLRSSGVEAARGDAGAAVIEPVPTVVVIGAAGPLPRDRVDPLVAAGTPHLILEGRDGALRLGPFVSPGQTACLRCVDAHEAGLDPRRALVVEQVAAAALVDPPPVDPVLTTWLAAWAAHDVLRFVDGEEPSLWSATVTVGGPHLPVTTPWARHPHCGCAWDLTATGLSA